MRSPRTLTALLPLLVVGCAPPASRLGAYLVDADPAMGLFLKDPDDGFAIAHLAHALPGELAGVSLGFGNTDDLAHQERVTRELLGYFPEVDAAVNRGASGPGDPSDTDAVRAIIRALEAAPRTIVALGRLTNVAEALTRRPDLEAQVTSLVIVGGRREELVPAFGPSGIVFPDSNIEGDGAALEALLATSVPIVLAPTELAAQLQLSSSDLDGFAARSSVGAWLATAARDWLALFESLLSQPGFYPFDLMATIQIDPELRDLVGCEDILSRVELGPDLSFQKRAGLLPRLLVSTSYTEGRPVRYCASLDPAAKPRILARMLP